MSKLGINLPRLNNIYLTGFMGAGKSTVGVLLAKKMDWEFEDIDLFIERQSRMSIATLFTSLGEQELRRLETAALQQMTARKNRVVALGGGSFLKPENRILIRQSGLSLYLRAQVHTLEKRLSKELDHRPLLKPYQGDQLTRHVQGLLEIRSSHYETADLVVDTDEKDVSEVVREVMDLLLLQAAT